jgi:predicted  nucleic acid-binding Zn-ribbon protein
MPPAKKSTAKKSTAKKSTSGRRTTTRKSSAIKEDARIKRLNKSLDSAQDALTALRKDLTKDVGSGARGLYKDLETFVKNARRDSGKLGKALQKDVERLQQQIEAATKGRKTTSSARRRPAKSTAKRGSTRSRSRSGSGTASRSRSR